MARTPPGPERAGQQLHVRGGIGQEQEHPAREDQVVGIGRQVGIDQVQRKIRLGPSAVPSWPAASSRVAKGDDRSTASTVPATRRRSSMCSEPWPGPISSTFQPRGRRADRTTRATPGSHSFACARSRAASRAVSPSTYSNFRLTTGILRCNDSSSDDLRPADYLMARPCNRSKLSAPPDRPTH